MTIMVETNEMSPMAGQPMSSLLAVIVRQHNIIKMAHKWACPHQAPGPDE